MRRPSTQRRRGRGLRATGAGAGLLSLALSLAACGSGEGGSEEVSLLVGSALAQVCEEAATTIASRRPRLEDGTVVTIRCRAAGSGDVVDELLEAARQVQNGSRPADDSTIPTLISLDGELYHQQLRHRMQQLEPTADWIPAITDSPRLASSPMVFMTTAELAPGLRELSDPFTALARASSHRELDPGSADQPVRYVHTAPTRSNSGLQTLVAQFVAVSGKRPEEISSADVAAHAADVAAIQTRITRYGSSTGELARAMVRNGPFWASIGSVYESSVVEANAERRPDRDAMVAVYPQATYTSTMRAILPRGPWVSERERRAAELVIEEWLSPAVQTIVARHGLRPANPAVAPEAITRANGVDPEARYDSLRSPVPEVVEAMISAWVQSAKKPSRVVLVVDSSGSMKGEKLPAVASSLDRYFRRLGPREQVAVIDFDNRIQPPVLVDGSEAGQARGRAFLAALKADGGTHLYDAVLSGRDWLLKHGQPEEILAVVVLTDGFDKGSRLSLEALNQQLAASGFEGDERIAVFAVGYGEAGSFDEAVLRSLAEGNGGEYKEGQSTTIRRLMDELQLAF
ncbi:VWA domain-containing protein [Synechococcus sp. RSCCF101]|nr:VWA domain-containing protein [Synechococcus sp. RSCCF101]